jgi:hypothetical protein
MVAFIMAHFVKVELQSKCSFELNREVSEYEEGSIAVILVLETMERRDQGASQCSA